MHSPCLDMQDARSVSERLVEKHLTENQMFGSRQTPGQSPPPETLSIYIHWYINGYGSMDIL